MPNSNVDVIAELPVLESSHSLNGWSKWTLSAHFKTVAGHDVTREEAMFAMVHLLLNTAEQKLSESTLNEIKLAILGE